MSEFKPSQNHLSLGDAFFDRVTPADFPQTILRHRDQRWARRMGLGDLSEAQWLAHFGRFEPLPGSLPQPLALRYHGHQFRVYNPDIGDGRGFTFAQLRDDEGRLLDFGTKGSGQTPYSRTADGRLTLKGGVREILATEMLEALGVNSDAIAFAVLTLAYSTEDVNGVPGTSVPGSRALDLPDEFAGPEGTVGSDGGDGPAHGES